MALISNKRTRSDRVASIQLGPNILAGWLSELVTGRVLLRLAMALVAALAILFITTGWKPAFEFREGDVPTRSIVARVPFDTVDAAKTAVLRDQKRRDVLCFYENKTGPLTLAGLGSAIKDDISSLLGSKELDELSDDQRDTLELFLRQQEAQELSAAEALRILRGALGENGKFEKFDQAMRAVLDPISESGLLKSLSHDMNQGSQRSILVFPTGQPKNPIVVDVPRARLAEVSAELPLKVKAAFQQVFNTPDATILAKLVSNYLIPELANNTTLTYRQDLSEESRKKAEESVEPAIISYFPTVSTLAKVGHPITKNELSLLRAEYEAWIKRLSWGEMFSHGCAFMGMIFSMYFLCGFYIYHQFDRTIITDTSKLGRLLALVVGVFLLCRFASPDPWRAEIVPVILCAMTATIAFGKQVALMTTCCLALCITLSNGHDTAQFVMLCSGAAASALLIGRIRTRNKLFYVGLLAGIIVASTHMGADIVAGKLHVVSESATGSIENSNSRWLDLLPNLARESFRLGCFTVLSGTLMIGLLPFAERAFRVQTDLSLLELGDPAHPLLRQLAQRAPGTYNHSINVAAIAEAAADAIGAHGLLTRVGAYFHDIGKMFKPNYFIENQGQAGNCHDSLQPAMSTLVIIAHVKDGADLARRHRLPQPIIDFVEQHHGTTLVEHFYREATKRSQLDPNKEEVSETSFRYPGPKPQTREAAVLMLADSVESASRTLVEPTSSRIQNLVDQLAMKKLLDGQFDECGLTLQQLDVVKNSLIKSLTAIYHGRVTYSGQQSA
jgi:cyclic-di-AMP phosphodiesterase PgpH